MPLPSSPRPLFLLLLLALAAWGCGTTAVAPRSGGAAGRSAPAYTRTADHYRTAPDADALAAYLRADSDAGLLVSAHRGGPQVGYPENALATFERALSQGPVLLECDVRTAGDGALVLMHDETLDRTTTGTGPLDAQPLDALRRLLLVDAGNVVTPFRIPTLDEALAWAEGRAVLMLDVKPDVPPERVVEALQRHQAAGRAVVVVYSIADLQRYHRLLPDLVFSVPAETPDAVEALRNSGVPTTRMIAFTGVGEVQPGVVERLHALNIRAIAGTFGLIDERAERGGPEVYHTLLTQGVDVLATDRVALALQAVDGFAPPGAR
jgi:glycerophosphoryl diester phosphodiesterase